MTKELCEVCRRMGRMVTATHVATMKPNVDLRITKPVHVFFCTEHGADENPPGWTVEPIQGVSN